MAWSIGGWLVAPFLQKLGADATALKQRIAAELMTTFAGHYSKEVSLFEALEPAEIAVHGQRATGQKYLINPAKGAGPAIYAIAVRERPGGISAIGN